MPYPSNTSSRPFWLFIAILAIALTITGTFAVLFYLETKVGIQAIHEKLDNQSSIIIPKYDSITQTRLDTIEARRAMSHRHVDNMYSGELQRVLDSLYNCPK